MASVATEPNGRRRVIFKGLDGKRRVVRVGTLALEKAKEFGKFVDAIVIAAAAGMPVDRVTAEWINSLSDDFAAKLAAVGVLAPRQKIEAPAGTPIGPFADAYLAKRDDMKPASRLVLGHVVRNLKDHFGEERDLKTISPGEADDFARWLATGARSRGKSAKSGRVKGLSPATIGKRLQWCSTIFRDAMRRKIITENPFAGLKQPKATNPDRQHYVPAATIEAVIAATADPEWKLLLALSRYLGLRVPSEPFSLTWECVDWERGRLRVPSPKTAVHGKSYRVVPILPEIRPHLDALFFDPANEGREFILTRLRSRDSAKSADRGYWANMNLRQHFLRLLERAGVKPWPKLFHNLRSSAQTDLAGRFPIHVVCDWLGNTQAVAQDHYLQTTDEHFTAASGAPGPQGVARNPARAGGESGGMEGTIETPETKKPLENKGFRRNSMEGRGFEQSMDSNRKNAISGKGGAQSGARLMRDERLGELVALWDRLGTEERRQLLELAQALADPRSADLA